MSAGLSRARYLAEAAAAVARGDWAGLPVLAVLSGRPLAALCPDCRGTGYRRRRDGLAVCWCARAIRPHGHPGFDWPRAARRTNMMRAAWHADGERVYLPCDACSIVPADGSVAEDAVPPWQPDCPLCQDTGWRLARFTPAIIRAGTAA